MKRRYAHVLLLTLALSCSKQAMGELDRLNDDALSEVSGQGGIYLSGGISINEMGGPIENGYFGRCDDAGKKCGARLAY